MKPRVKNDSWVYTASSSSIRKKIKRLKQKRHRRDDKAVTEAEKGL